MESMSGFGDVDDFEGIFSFTTTASDFNSDDDDGNEYIEIALGHHHQEEEEEELDCLRISFSSSSAALPNFPELIISDECDETLPNPKTQHNESEKPSSTPCSLSSRIYNTRRRRITSQLPTSFGRILDSLMQLSFRVTSLKGSSGGGGGGDGQTQLTIHHHADNRDFLRNTNNNNRKAYSSEFQTTASTENNNSSGIMKLFIKLRGIKIGTLIASIAKPRRVGVVAVVPSQSTTGTDINNNNKKTSRESTVEYYRRLTKPLALHKWLLQKNKDQILTTSIEAMSITTINNGGKDSPTSSIKSSPLHNKLGVPISDKYFSRENSIQSAIAHCKTSFATTTSSSHDFTF